VSDHTEHRSGFIGAQWWLTGPEINPTNWLKNLARPVEMSFAAASKYVQVLEKAGLVNRRAAGRQHLCTLKAEQLREANDWLSSYERFWAGNLDRLARTRIGTRPPGLPRRPSKRRNGRLRGTPGAFFPAFQAPVVTLNRFPP
jgi:hypothetical protein